MSAATTAAHSGRGHMPGESLRQESVTMDMLEVSRGARAPCNIGASLFFINKNFSFRLIQKCLYYSYYEPDELMSVFVMSI